MRTYVWVSTVLVAAVVVVGGLVAWLDPGLLLPAGTELTRGVRLYGYRMAARNLALGAGLLVVVLLRWRPGVAALLGVVALVEIGDTVSAISSADWASAGPAVVIAVVATLTAATVATLDVPDERVDPLEDFVDTDLPGLSRERGHSTGLDGFS